MPFAEIDQQRVHYQQKLDAGSDAPHIILMHGFTSNLSVWMFGGVMEGLADDFQITAFDMRGHGASSVAASGYSSDVIATDLFQLMDHLEIEQAALLGHSFGGVSAVHAASIHPQRVTAIVLSDAYFPGLRDLEPNMGQARVWQDLRDTLLEVETDIGPEVDFPLLFSLVDQWTDKERSHLRERLGPVGERWLSGLVRLADTTAGTEAFEPAGLDRDKIASTSVPVLALYDEHSPFGATNDFLIQNLADCRQSVVPDANHLAPLENPSEIVRQTKQFLASLKTT